MGKLTLKKKIKALNIILAVIFCALFISGLIFLIYFMNIPDADMVRPYVSQISGELSKGSKPQIEGVKYAVFTFDGKIEFSGIAKYEAGQTIDLKTLTSIDGKKDGGGVYYAAPLIDSNGNQIGTLLLLINKNLVSKSRLLYASLIILLCLVFIIGFIIIINQYLILKNEIINPVKQLNCIAEKMLAGNLDEKLVYDYTDEIGELCHSLENLRDELNASRTREIILKKNEKFLLACISHDLKTPLAVILGNAESLRDGIIDKKAASAAIINKSKQLSKLIDDILEQTKTELNELSIKMTECYAKEFFENECLELALEVEKNGIKFTALPCPECLIKIDKQRVVQVMQNLVSNSVKYTKKGGLIKISFELQNKFLIISVSDTGSGIPAEDIPFIFDKFFRGERARNMNIQGSGLGLAITKYIVEKHGGTIECETVVDKGTKISFSIPLNF